LKSAISYSIFDLRNFLTSSHSSIQLRDRSLPLTPLLFRPGLSKKTKAMKIIRLYTGTDNESHFEEKEVDFKFSGDTEVSATEPAIGIIFRRAPTTHLSDFHPAPRRQYVITLSGQVEIETGDGTVKRFGPGDVMLADDTTGHGHVTRVVGNQPRVYVMIPLK
jgi:hypothetical protein